MKITATMTAANKRHLNSITADYRKDGWSIVTYGDTLRELEKGDEMIVIYTGNPDRIIFRESGMLK